MTLIIFDLNGTLLEGVPNGRGGERPPNRVEEMAYLPGVELHCLALKQEGHTLAIATNQGGVAYGIFPAETAEEMVRLAADAIGAKACRVCFFHPLGKVEPYNRDDETRKPKPGMLLSLMEELHFTPADTLVVGDWPSDKLAAEAAGCQFQWAADFFKRDGFLE